MTKTAVRYAVLGILFVTVAWLPFLYGAVTGDMTLLLRTTNEGGIYEVVGALGFLITGVLFGIAFIRSGQSGENKAYRLRRVVYLILAVAFVLAAIEETSWGQWIVGFDPPDAVAAVNAQREFNMHNLYLPGGGTPGPLLRRMFNLGWLTFAVLIPLAGLWAPARRLLERFIPVLPPIFGLPFLLDYGLMRGIMLGTGGAFQDVHYRLSEVHETCASVLLVLALVYVVFGEASRQTQPSAVSPQPSLNQQVS